MTNSSKKRIKVATGNYYTTSDGRMFLTYEVALKYQELIDKGEPQWVTSKCGQLQGSASDIVLWDELCCEIEKEKNIKKPNNDND